MRLIFSEQAWEAYLDRQRQDRKLLQRIFCKPGDGELLIAQLRYRYRDDVACTSMYIHPAMATTRLFRNGHSQAVRIPADLAYERTNLELEIERIGDEIRIRPAARPIAGALEALASFSPTFMAGGRGEQEQQERPEL